MRRGVDWDAEWTAAWKPHVDNAWFGYQRDVYADWLQRAHLDIAARVLKTDAFDEACGLGHLQSLTQLGAAGAIVMMDVSHRILEQAAARQRGLQSAPCATDVCDLAFRTSSFDLVFSPSTLDHFEDEATIETAVRELHRVLRSQGRLLITLDNPVNPIIRARQMLYRLTGPIGGLIPFPMGPTLSQARLHQLLDQTGFQVVDSSYILHAPRVLALWLGEHAARRCWSRLSRRLAIALHLIERLGARLPTRRWSGHYVIADCRKR